MPAKIENFPLYEGFNSPPEFELEKYQSPAEYYQTLFQRGFVAGHRDVFYISGPLNHYGAARLNHSVQGGAFTENAKIKSLIADFIAEDNPDIQIVLPHHLGTRPGWGEFHYNFLWMCFLSGIRPDATASIYEQAREQINIRLINDKSDMSAQAIERKRGEYKKMLDMFKREWSLEENSQTLMPVKGIIAIPDSNMSLGGQLEKEAAKYLGIPVYSVVLNTGVGNSAISDRLDSTHIPQILQLQRDGHAVSPLFRTGNLLPFTAKQAPFVDEDKPFVINTESGPVTLIEEFSEETIQFETFESGDSNESVLRKKLHNAENAAVLISGIVGRYLRGDSGSNGYGPEKMMFLSKKDGTFSMFLDWIDHLYSIGYLPRSNTQLGLISEKPTGKTFFYPPSIELTGNIASWRSIGNGNEMDQEELNSKYTVVIFGSAIEGDPAAEVIGKSIGVKGGICIVGGDGRNASNAMSQVTSFTRESGGISGAITTEYLAHHQPPDSVNHHQSIIGKNMATRKGVYYASGDAFIALKGGIGTTEEIISTIIFNLRAKMQGRTPKPMILINTETDGKRHWDKLLPWIERIGLRDEITVLSDTSDLDKAVFA